MTAEIVEHVVTAGTMPYRLELVLLTSMTSTGLGAEDEGSVLTREILSDPAAIAEIAAAREEIARGDYVQGADAIRALRPRR